MASLLKELSSLEAPYPLMTDTAAVFLRPQM
jgi:hypothetical protein